MHCGELTRRSGPLITYVPTSDWTLVDLRALRPYARSKKINDLPEDLRVLIFAADAALYLGGTHPGGNSLKDWLSKTPA